MSPPLQVDLERFGDLVVDLGQHAAHELAGGNVRADGAHDLGRQRREVDRRGDDRTLKPGSDELGGLHAGALLRLLGGCAQMRHDQRVVELMQGAVRARLVLPNVDARGEDLAGGDEICQRVDVVDAAARDVDQDDAVLHAGVLLGAEHADGLFGLGQVHRDEIGDGQDLVDIVVERDAELLGALGAAVRIVADELHAEGAGALGHQAADAAQAEDRERLLEELDAHELAALPLVRVHGGVRLGGVARAGEEEAHGLLGGGHDVRRRSVADDHAAVGGGGHIDVVDAHARAADDLEVRARLDDLARDLGARAHDEGVVAGDRLDQLLGREIEQHVDLEALLAQNLDAGIRQLVGDQHLHLIHCGILSPKHRVKRALRGYHPRDVRLPFPTDYSERVRRRQGGPDEREEAPAEGGRQVGARPSHRGRTADNGRCDVTGLKSNMFRIVT